MTSKFICLHIIRKLHYYSEFCVCNKRNGINKINELSCTLHRVFYTFHANVLNSQYSCSLVYWSTIYFFTWIYKSYLYRPFSPSPIMYQQSQLESMEKALKYAPEHSTLQHYTMYENDWFIVCFQVRPQYEFFGKPNCSC